MAEKKRPSNDLIRWLSEHRIEVDGLGPDAPPRFDEPPRGGSGGGASTSPLIPGKITAWNGSQSQLAKYKAIGLEDPTVVIDIFKTPLDRPFASSQKITNGDVDDPCYLIRKLNPSSGEIEWEIGRVFTELPVTTSCTQNFGAGAGFDEFASATEFGSGSKHFTQITIPSTDFAVTNTGSEKISLGYYTFPPEHIDLRRIDLTDLAISSGSVANKFSLGFGTAASSGSGTSLSGTETDWVPVITTPALDTTLKFTAAGRVRDGRGGAEKLYLNLAPTAAYGANDTITISGKVRLVWERINFGTN